MRPLSQLKIMILCWWLSRGAFFANLYLEFFVANKRKKREKERKKELQFYADNFCLSKHVNSGLLKDTTQC